MIHSKFTLTIFIAFLCSYSQAQVPIITSFSPLSGLPGTTVTISGSNFNTTPAQNAVYFSGVIATVTSASATQLVVKVPVYARFGSITVENLGTTLSCLSSNSFTPLFDNNKDFGGRIIPAAMSLPSNVGLSNNTGSDGSSISVADIDADGFPDLLVSQNGIDSLTFLRNKGIGDLTLAGFVKTQLYIPFGINKAIAQDIDGDGKLDLVIRRSDASGAYQGVSVYPNIGSSGTINISSFAAPYLVTLGINVVCNFFAVADIDLDGKPELILQSDFVGSKVSVFRNMSTPGNFFFSAPIDVLTNASYGITVGDVDGDGKPDLLAAKGYYVTSGFTITQNTSSPGSLSFGTPVAFAPASGAAFDYISLADLDNDGKPDVSFEAGGGAGIELNVMKNKAVAGVIDASSLATEIVYPWSNGQTSVANQAHVADINGDGKPDVIGTGHASGNSAMIISQNVGQTGVLDATSFLNGVLFGDGNSNVTPQYTTSGDLDGDGKPEVIVTNSSYSLHYISIYKNLTYPAPRVDALKNGATTIETAAVGASISTQGDFQFTNNQTPIVRFGTTKGAISTATNTAINITVPSSISTERVSVTLHGLTGFSPVPFNSTFPTSGTLDVNTFSTKVDFALTTSATSGLTVSDFDNDGKTDVLLGDGGNIRLFRNSLTASAPITAGTFASLPTITASIGANTISSADFDGDGLVDIQAGTNLFKNNSGTQANPISFETSVNVLPAFNTGRAKTNIDFNHDGKTDIVAVNSPSSVVVSENLSRQGSYYAYAPFAVFGATVTAYTATGTVGEASAGDFDGDGYDDIVFLNASAGQLLSMLNTKSNRTLSTNQFNSPQSIATGASPLYLIVRDFDLDGKLDVAVSYQSIASVSVFTNTSTLGTITFTKQDFTSLAAATRIDAADLDGDGKAEIVTIHGNGSSVLFNFSILKNTSTSTISFASKIDYALPTQPLGLAIADINLDSKPDILITRTGQFLSVFQNQLPTVALTINTQPNSIYSVCDGAAPTITTAATGTTNITYQWQYSPDGIVPFVDLTNTAGYSNVGTSSFTINSTGNFGAGKHRCKINGDFAPTVYSNTVSFSVNALPPTPIALGVNNCGSGSVTIAASGGSAGQYMWYDTGGLISGQINSTYVTPVISATTTYSVSINNGTCVSPKTSVIATINSIPSAPVVTSGSNCGTSTITLNASGGTNGQYRWYTISSGGTAITGEVNSSYVTPSISTTTSYYVSINNGTCESSRIPVVATINPIQVTPSITNASGCANTLFALNAAGGSNGQYRWYTVVTGGTAISGQVNSSYVTPTLTSSTTYYVSINNGTCESSRTPLAVTIITSGCTPPTIDTKSLATQVGGKVTLDLIPLIKTPGSNLDINSIQITSQPKSGAKASITNGVLTIDYTGVTFSGIEQLGIRACDQTGSCATQQFDIEVAGDIVVYNGLAPNGHLQNQKFIIEFIDVLPETKNNKVTIFDRWENQVWQGTNYDNNKAVFTGISDGGNDLPAGTYFYKIEFSSGRKTQTGFISLKR